MAKVNIHEPPEPKTAIDFLKRKVNVPTDKWNDLRQGEHSHAFTVAHSCEADILEDIHGLLNDAIAKGIAFGEFRNKMLDLMKEKKWYGGDGHTADDEKYINWRIGIIYDTNMGTAYSAQEYRDNLEGADLRPIWVWQSQLTGDNRRQEHLALHDKAFRYDDPFWDSYHPKKEFNCECYVITKSEHEAKRDKTEILSSDKSGNPPEVLQPDGTPVEWPKFCRPEWKYNMGLEALAPNFSKYKNLAKIKLSDGKSALSHVVEKYHQTMNETRLTEAEFKVLLRRMNNKDYNRRKAGILYQVGNLETERYQAMRQNGIEDSKIMAVDTDLYHGSGDKNEKQKIPENLLSDVYRLFQEPENIFENRAPDYLNDGREFHFIKETGGGKTLMVVLKQKITNVALKFKTMGWVRNETYKDKKFRKIW